MIVCVLIKGFETISEFSNKQLHSLFKVMQFTTTEVVCGTNESDIAIKTAHTAHVYLRHGKKKWAPPRTVTLNRHT